MSEVIQFGAPEKQSENAKELADIADQLAVDARAAKNTNRRGAQAALTLKLAGASYSEIAQTLEYDSPRDAQAAVEMALAAATPVDEEVRSQRSMLSLQLDNIIRNHAVQASDKRNVDQIAHSRLILSTLDRKARLLGLDAPILIQKIDPAGDEFNRILLAAAAGSGLSIPSEADVFEAEAEWVEPTEDADEVTDA